MITNVFLFLFSCQISKRLVSDVDNAKSLLLIFPVFLSTTAVLDDFRDRQRGRQRREEWDYRGGGGGFRRDRTTKSGRVIKGRGVFVSNYKPIEILKYIEFHLQRYRTPSRSKSRSVTPVHWRKEESRVIKLAEYEAELKHKVEHGKREERSEDRGKENGESRKEIDYNALDYEQENQSDEDVPRKQVPSLVQYPLPGATKKEPKKRRDSTTETDTTDDRKKDELVQNARSDAWAMALGVTIKTGVELSDLDQRTGG